MMKLFSELAPAGWLSSRPPALPSYYIDFSPANIRWTFSLKIDISSTVQNLIRERIPRYVMAPAAESRLGRVGRYKINQRLKVNVPLDHTVLTEEDFVAIIRYLLDLSEGRGFTDDIEVSV